MGLQGSYSAQHKVGGASSHNANFTGRWGVRSRTSDGLQTTCNGGVCVDVFFITVLLFCSRSCKLSVPRGMVVFVLVHDRYSAVVLQVGWTTANVRHKSTHAFVLQPPRRMILTSITAAGINCSTVTSVSESE